MDDGGESRPERGVAARRTPGKNGSMGVWYNDEALASVTARRTPGKNGSPSSA